MCRPPARYRFRTGFLSIVTGLPELGERSGKRVVVQWIARARARPKRGRLPAGLKEGGTIHLLAKAVNLRLVKP